MEGAPKRETKGKAGVSKDGENQNRDEEESFERARSLEGVVEDMDGVSRYAKGLGLRAQVTFLLGSHSLLPSCT